MFTLSPILAVDSSTVATGIGGIVGNKGAVAISVYLGSTSFLFVNAHLTGTKAIFFFKSFDLNKALSNGFPLFPTDFSTPKQHSGEEQRLQKNHTGASTQ